MEGPSRPLIPRDYVPEVAAPEVAGASDLAPVRVGDWIVFSADEDFWIRDLELAERAGLTQPRNIRPIIRKAIDLGALTVLPRGACEARPTGIGSARAACATNGAVVRVETVVLPKGNHGGTQEADEFYLNEEAALFIVTRLRAKAAIRLTQSVIRVFVLVRRGELVAPSPALTRADFEALTGKFLSVVSAAPVPFARTVAELQQGMERLVRHHGDLAALVEQARAERLPPRRKDVERMVRFIAREEVALANRSLRPDHDLPPDQDPHPRNARTKR